MHKAANHYTLAYGHHVTIVMLTILAMLRVSYLHVSKTHSQFRPE